MGPVTKGAWWEGRAGQGGDLLLLGGVRKDLFLLGGEGCRPLGGFAGVLDKKEQVPAAGRDAKASPGRPVLAARAGEHEHGGTMLDFSPSVTKTRRAQMS